MAFFIAAADWYVPLVPMACSFLAVRTKSGLPFFDFFTTNLAAVEHLL